MVLGADEEGRKCPFLSVHQWNETLTLNSFSKLELVLGDDDARTLMIAGVVERVEESSPSLVQIVYSNPLAQTYPDFTQDLYDNFQKRGLEASLAPWPMSTASRNVIYVILDYGETPLLANASPEQFKQVTSLLTQGTQILWLSAQAGSDAARNPEKGLMSGLARVARAENHDLNLVLVDVQESILMQRQELIESVAEVLHTSFCVPTTQGSMECEYLYQNGQLLIPRLVPDSELNNLITTTADEARMEIGLFHQPHRPLKLHVAKPGLLDTLRFITDESVQQPLGPREIELQVKAFGINFKDVFVALGQLKSTTQMVGECAGVVTAVGLDFQTMYRVGDRVCSWNGTPYASKVRVDASTVCHIPISMSFSIAASIPIAFMTAYYGLIELANLRKHQTVLIHSAAGGVGQAALMIAQHIGATIYATVGSEPKRRLLIERFGLRESHIFWSRSKNFKKGILEVSCGNGVDVILNSLSGEALHDSWDCIAKFGTFIEIGKSDIYRRSELSMEPLDKMTTFTALDVALMSKYQPERLQPVLKTVLSMFEAKLLRSHEPVTIMPISEMESAFRLIQAGKHTGKVVLSAEDDVQVKIVLDRPRPLKLDETATYLVVGGLGTIGRDLVRFMVTHGARHIVVFSRRKFEYEEEQALERNLGSSKARIYVKTCDITELTQVQDVLLDCRKNLPSIKGIIQAAMVLQASSPSLLRCPSC